MALITLNELAAALHNDSSCATTITITSAATAPIANPTFTGTVGGISEAMVDLANMDNTNALSKPARASTQSALYSKASF